MLYNYETLNRLAEYKSRRSSNVGFDLLSALLENSRYICLDTLLSILSKEGAHNEKRLEKLRESLPTKFNRIFRGDFWICAATPAYSFVKFMLTPKHEAPASSIVSHCCLTGSCTNYIDELPIHPYSYSEYMEYLRAPDEITSSPIIEIPEDFLNAFLPSDKLDELDILFSNPRLKETYIGLRRLKKAKRTQTNTLNFVSTQVEKRVQLDKFAPVDLSSATFVYNRKSIVKRTQRMRDDLVAPTRLQFIKLHDQVSPPIYRKRGEAVHALYSYKRLPQVIDYDYDSSQEWEVVSDGVSCDTVTESVDSGAGSEADWVEPDSEPDNEVNKYNKKPTFSFEPVKMEQYFPMDRYRNANLVPSEAVSGDLFKDVCRELSKGAEKQEISRMYNLVGNTVDQITVFYKNKCESG